MSIRLRSSGLEDSNKNEKPSPFERTLRNQGIRSFLDSESIQQKAIPPHSGKGKTVDAPGTSDTNMAEFRPLWSNADGTDVILTSEQLREQMFGPRSKKRTKKGVDASGSKRKHTHEDPELTLQHVATEDEGPPQKRHFTRSSAKTNADKDERNEVKRRSTRSSKKANEPNLPYVSSSSSFSGRPLADFQAGGCRSSDRHYRAAELQGLKKTQHSHSFRSSQRLNIQNSAQRNVITQAEDATEGQSQMPAKALVHQSQIDMNWTDVRPANVVRRCQKQLSEQEIARRLREEKKGTDRKVIGEVRRLKNGRGYAFRDVENPKWTKAEFHHLLRERFIYEDAIVNPQYIKTPAKGLADTNITSCCENQMHWTSDTATVRDPQGRKLLVNDFQRNENTVKNPPDWVLEDGTVVIDVNGHAVKWFDGIPKTISSEIEPWRMEGMRAFNGMKVVDVMARMPKYTLREDGRLELLQLPSAFTNRSIDWRDRNGLKSLKKGKPRQPIVISDDESEPEGSKSSKKHKFKRKLPNLEVHIKEEHDAEENFFDSYQPAAGKRRRVDDEIPEEDPNTKKRRSAPRTRKQNAKAKKELPFPSNDHHGTTGYPDFAATPSAQVSRDRHGFNPLSYDRNGFADRPVIDEEFDPFTADANLANSVGYGYRNNMRHSFSQGQSNAYGAPHFDYQAVPHSYEQKISVADSNIFGYPDLRPSSFSSPSRTKIASSYRPLTPYHSSDCFVPMNGLAYASSNCVNPSEIMMNTATANQEVYDTGVSNLLGDEDGYFDVDSEYEEDQYQEFSESAQPSGGHGQQLESGDMSGVILAPLRAAANFDMGIPFGDFDFREYVPANDVEAFEVTEALQTTIDSFSRAHPRALIPETTWLSFNNAHALLQSKSNELCAARGQQPVLLLTLSAWYGSLDNWKTALVS